MAGTVPRIADLAGVGALDPGAEVVGAATTVDTGLPLGAGDGITGVHRFLAPTVHTGIAAGVRRISTGQRPAGAARRGEK